MRSVCDLVVAPSNDRRLLCDPHQSTVLAPEFRGRVPHRTMVAVGFDLDQHPVGRSRVDDADGVVEAVMLRLMFLALVTMLVLMMPMATTVMMLTMLPV